jgi:hypothetical protein
VNASPVEIMAVLPGFDMGRSAEDYDRELLGRFAGAVVAAAG